MSSRKFRRVLAGALAFGVAAAWSQAGPNLAAATTAETNPPVDTAAADSTTSGTAAAAEVPPEFADGSVGFASDGTPVDCVRFAELGLVGERPELIVSGINHGANLGDDITYSGTVAAALEGIVLGIPAIAVSV